MQAPELLWLAKRHVSGQSDLNSEEIKPVTLAIIELYLSKGISWLVSQSVENSVEIFKILYQLSGRVYG